ncbi:acyltransferase [Streptomyces sp. NPDC048659]|uniref:acyltransferase n=1 Tax=Streptomyces sp. NPDC048659 TaxID=3155489 RepID=UPI0034456127
MMGMEDILRLTVSALMTRTGERQGDLAAGLGQSQAQVSRKQAGKSHWSLEDVDLLAAHYGLNPLDLLAGPTHAVGVLHGAAASLQGGVQALAVSNPPAARRPSAPPAASAPEPEPEHKPERKPDQAPGRPCVLCGRPATLELDGFPQHLTVEECAAAIAETTPARQAETLPTPEPEPSAAPEPRAEVPEQAHPHPHPDPDPDPQAQPQPQAAAQPTPHPDSSLDPTPQTTPDPRPRPTRPAPGYASGTLVEQIADRVHDVLAACSGEVEAAQAELIKMAIPDVMRLLKSSRVGGRYEHSEFPPTAEILRKKSQKGADDIWEGRPKWRNPALFAAAKKGAEIEVTALDMNAAYLSAMKAWLPIGQLREEVGGAHDPKKAGVHLVTPAEWLHDDLPNPLGARIEPGELWVSESTLRLLLDCARQGLADAPVIHRSLVSGASEALLEKLRRALAETRKTALEAGDELTVAYVKAMYSKFVSTIGESSANREIRRPDWMHIIRSKAFANLWMKAHKAHKAGLQVVEISGTDELHIAGDWRTVFPEGRELNQVKEKQTYVLGGRR